MISPVATAYAAWMPNVMICSGLGTSLTVGYSRLIRSDVAAVSDPSATTISTEPL